VERFSTPKRMTLGSVLIARLMNGRMKMSKTAWVNRANYEAWLNGEEGAESPFLWEKESRHADMALVPVREPSEPVGGPWKLWNGWGPANDGLMRVERIGPSLGGLEAFYNTHKTDIQATLEDLRLVVNAVNLYLQPSEPVEGLDVDRYWDGEPTKYSAHLQPPTNQQAEPVAWLIEWWNKLTDKWTYFELVEKEPTPSEFGDPNVFRWRPLYLNPPSREHLAASSATCSPTALGSQVGRLRYPGLEREALDHEAMERLRTEGISISRQSEGWFYKAEHHMAGHFYTAADPADAILGGPEDE